MNMTVPRMLVLHVYVIQDGKPAGTARLIPYGDDAAKIERVAVLQGYRGQGIGGMLLTALEGQELEHRAPPLYPRCAIARGAFL